MSRKYCSTCGILHKNKSLGLCDSCLEEELRYNAKKEQEKADRLKYFLSLSEEERWIEVFNFMDTK